MFFIIPGRRASASIRLSSEAVPQAHLRAPPEFTLSLGNIGNRVQNLLRAPFTAWSERFVDAGEETQFFDQLLDTERFSAAGVEYRRAAHPHH